MGVEWTIWNKLCLIWASVYEKKKQKSKRMRKRWCLGGWWLRGQGHFVGRFRVRSASLKTFQTLWLAKHCLVLFRWPSSLYRSTVCIFTLDLISVQCLCFHNPFDTAYTIYNVCTWSFNACVYTCVCIYIFCRTEWLPLSWRGQGLGAPFFFHLGGPLGSLLWNSRSNIVFADRYRFI